MPNSKERWYQRKRPRLQISILKFVAYNGESSQKQIIHQFKCKPSTISEAFKILKERKLIQQTENLDFKRPIGRERFYKLSPTGLSHCIDEIPSPHEFWIMMMWYCNLNPNHINHNKFGRFYDSYIEKFVGNFPLRSCFFLGTFFNTLFGEWGPTMYTPDKEDIKIETHIYNDTTLTYKVLEYLLLNRSVTIKDIVASTQLPEREVKNILNAYSRPTDDESYYISSFAESNYVTNKSITLVKDLLSHLIVVPAAPKKEGDGDKVTNNNQNRYELSLLGIFLMLATISLMHQNKPIFSPLRYYDKIASNYPEKLPLIFGKWDLLKSDLRFEIFPSIFDYLFLDKSEISSLSVMLGGNKEIYDNVMAATLASVNNLSMVYDAGITALNYDNLEEFLSDEHYTLIRDKLDKIERILRYSSLESFHYYMMKRRSEISDLNYAHVSLTNKHMPVGEVSQKMEMKQEERKFKVRDELHFIENAIAEEFSFLFYIGLLRSNTYRASDYPLTIGSIIANYDTVYPNWFLMKIVHEDAEIRNRVLGWIDETLNLQGLALEKIKQISAEIQSQSR